MDFEITSLPLTQCIFLISFAGGVFIGNWTPLLIVCALAVTNWFIKSISVDIKQINKTKKD